MGVLGLYQLIKRFAPKCMTTQHLSMFGGKTIAIDGHQIIIRMLRSYNDIPDTLYHFMKLIDDMVSYNINVICIFDGKEPNRAKEHERSSRRKKRMKDESDLAQLNDEIKEIIENEQSFDNVPDINDIYDIFESYSNTSLDHIIAKIIIKLRSLNINDIGSNNRQLIDNISKIMRLFVRKIKLSNRLLYISRKTIKVLVDKLNLIGITALIASSEADFVINNMSTFGHVDAVYSGDSDMLTHGTPILIRSINSKSNQCTCYNLSRLLQLLKISYDQFIDMCIILGTDYNPRINNNGPIRAYNTIIAHNTLVDYLISERIEYSEKYIIAKNIFINGDNIMRETVVSDIRCDILIDNMDCFPVKKINNITFEMNEFRSSIKIFHQINKILLRRRDSYSYTYKNMSMDSVSDEID